MEPKRNRIRRRHILAYTVIGLVAGTLTGVADLGALTGGPQVIVGTGWWPLLLLSRPMTRNVTWPVLIAYMGVLAASWMATEILVFAIGHRPTAVWEWGVLMSILVAGLLAAGYGAKACQSISN